MPDSYDLSAGLLNGLQQGLIGYMNADEKKKDRAEKMQDREDTRGATAAKALEDRMLKVKELRMKAMESGYDPSIVDDQGNITGPATLRPDYLKMKTDQAAANPLNKLLSPAEKKIDETAGKDYSDYFAAGGYAGVDKNLKGLEHAKGLLAKPENATGTWKGLLPKPVRDFVQPGLSTAEDDVKGAVQASLRQTLGAQFTEKEGQAIFERAFNPRLSAEENIRRIDSVANEIRSQAKAKQDAGEALQKRGTLKGYNATGGLVGGTQPPQFPMTVKKGNQTATVSNPQELKEAAAEGYQ